MQTIGLPRTKEKTSANRDLVSTSVLALWPGLEKKCVFTSVHSEFPTWARSKCTKCRVSIARKRE